MAKKRKYTTYTEAVKHKAVKILNKEGITAAIKFAKCNSPMVYKWRIQGYGKGATPKDAPIKITTQKPVAKAKAKAKVKAKPHQVAAETVEQKAEHNADVIDLSSFKVEIVTGIEVQSSMHSRYDGMFPFEDLAKISWKKGDPLVGFFIPYGYKDIDNVQQVLTSQTTKFNQQMIRQNRKVKFSCRASKEVRKGEVIYGAHVIRVEP